MTIRSGPQLITFIACNLKLRTAIKSTTYDRPKVRIWTKGTQLRKFTIHTTLHLFTFRTVTHRSLAYSFLWECWLAVPVERWLKVRSRCSKMCRNRIRKSRWQFSNLEIWPFWNIAGSDIPRQLPLIKRLRRYSGKEKECVQVLLF